MAIPVRRTGVLCALLMLAGCGFSPMYKTTGSHIGPDGRPTAGNVLAELKQVYVARINERYGPLLRQALQQDMGGAGPENPTRYVLRIRTYLMNEAVDIPADNTSGRTRTTAFAHWTLETMANDPEMLAGGDASVVDGVNNNYEQYFAQTLNLEGVRARVAKNLGEQVTQQVAAWFRTHAKPAISGSVRGQNQPRYTDPNGIINPNNQMPAQQPGADGMPTMATGRTDAQLNGENNGDMMTPDENGPMDNTPDTTTQAPASTRRGTSTLENDDMSGISIGGNENR